MRLGSKPVTNAHAGLEIKRIALSRTLGNEKNRSFDTQIVIPRRMCDDHIKQGQVKCEDTLYFSAVFLIAGTDSSIVSTLLKLFRKTSRI